MVLFPDHNPIWFLVIGGGCEGTAKKWYVLIVLSRWCGTRFYFPHEFLLPLGHCSNDLWASREP